MPEFKNECCRMDNFTLTKALEINRGYERVVENVNGLSGPTAAELRKSINNRRNDLTEIGRSTR